MSRDHSERPIVVRGTEIVASDPVRLRLQKLARITLDSMVQFSACRARRRRGALEAKLTARD